MECLCAAGPHLGAQFAQLVKELRSEYAAAVTSCAERIAGALFLRPGYSINTTLQRHGITGTPTVMQQQVGRGAHGSAAFPPRSLSTLWGCCKARWPAQASLQPK